MLQTVLWSVLSNALAIIFALTSLYAFIKLYGIAQCVAFGWLIIIGLYGLLCRTLMLLDSIDGVMDWAWAEPMLATLWIFVTIGTWTFYAVMKRTVKMTKELRAQLKEAQDKLEAGSRR